MSVLELSGTKMFDDITERFCFFKKNISNSSYLIKFGCDGINSILINLLLSVPGPNQYREMTV